MRRTLVLRSLQRIHALTIRLLVDLHFLLDFSDISDFEGSFSPQEYEESWEEIGDTSVYMVMY